MSMIDDINNDPELTDRMKKVFIETLELHQSGKCAAWNVLAGEDVNKSGKLYFDPTYSNIKLMEGL